MFLPTTASELKKLKWDKLDIILVTGDAYIDSPYIGVAVIGRILSHAGYRVGIIAQPDVKSDVDIRRLGEPALFWGITGGCMDSMVANYTATKKKRLADDLTAGGKNNRRPDERDARIAPRRRVRERLRPVRPRLQGVRPGRGAGDRRDPKQFGLFFVRSAKGDMVPLDTLVSTRATAGPTHQPVQPLPRGRGHRRAGGRLQLGAGVGGAQGGRRRGAASRDGLRVGRPLVPGGAGAVARSHVRRGHPAGVPRARRAVQSWSLPFSVLLGTPFAAFGAFFGLWVARHSSLSYVNNIFAQIGLIMLIGFSAAKNAILIVEFAKMLHEQGKDLATSALESARLRFRPILMTAFAFILGVVPLVRASGAGADRARSWA